MSKQHNKAEKRRRRNAYLKRKVEAAKAKTTQAKPSKVEEPAPKA